MTRLLSRLRLMHKLMLMGGLAMASICALLAIDIADAVQRHRAVSAARAGLEPSRALLQVVQLTQQHRGLTSNVLGGRADAEPQRAAKQQEVDAAQQRVQALLDRDALPARVRADRRERQAEWQAVSQAVVSKQVTGPQSLARHGALIAGWLELHDRVLEHAGLTLDADPASHFLALAMLQDNPRMTELMGQARARGTGLLARQQATPEERAALAALLERVRALQRQMQVSLEKAFDADAALKAALGPELERTQAQVQSLLDLARTQVLEAAELKLAPGDYFKQTTVSIDAAFALKDLAMKSLDAQLQARQSALLRSDALLYGGCALLMLGSLAVGLMTVRSIVAPVQAARDAARRIAAGDLAFEVRVDSQDELGELQQAMHEMRDGLARVVGQVRQSAENVATASAQIAQGNTDLSQRTEEQASSLQTTASTMDELGATVRNNAEHARQANQLAQGASDVAMRGGTVVQDVVQTMSGISESSRRIADIIGTIDGIAFQTNILALNAAVEAARAGEQGRGFAVVAGEVRALAGRSAEAAREIKSLIGASVQRVEQGAAQVDEAGRTMQEVVSSIRRVSDIVGEISASSAEQDSGVHQVGEAVTQMDRATQQNAALVEESAAAAESLRQQAEGLVQVVSVFRLA